MGLKGFFYCVLTLPFFIFNFCTMFMFAYFLSVHSYLHYPLIKQLEDGVAEEGSWKPLLLDFCLLSLFMAQHSLQSKSTFKFYLTEKGFLIIERLLYNTTSCIVLQILMYHWQPVHGWVLWDLTTDSAVISWMFSVLHMIAWATIYVGCLLFDMCELMGLKQIYYHIQSWPSPMFQKASGLRRLYEHMRHPGFTALTFITLVHPVMQADRLLLLYVFTIYMIFAFQVDDRDSSYHKRQLQIKKAELQVSFNK